MDRPKLFGSADAEKITPAARLKKSLGKKGDREPSPEPSRVESPPDEDQSPELQRTGSISDLAKTATKKPRPLEKYLEKREKEKETKKSEKKRDEESQGNR